MNYYETIPNPNGGTAGYICLLCGTDARVAPSEIKIIRHLQRRHPEENLKLKIISPSSSALNNNKLKMQLVKDGSDGERMTKKNALSPLTEEDVFFPCDHCEDTFRLRRKLFHHIEEEHRIFPCKSCGLQFKLRMEKKNHRCPSQIGKQSAVVSSKEEETEKLEETDSNSTAAKSVIQPKKNQERRKSNVINRKSGRTVGASNAPKWFDGAKYECSICSCIHHNPDSFKMHLRKVHNVTNPVVKDYEVETAGPYTCKICGSILKRYRSNIESHIIRHTGSCWLIDGSPFSYILEYFYHGSHLYCIKQRIKITFLCCFWFFRYYSLLVYYTIYKFYNSNLI